jgi:hypothetical protein
MAEDHPSRQPPPHHHIPTTQDPLSSVRLQHFNYLSPAASGQASSQQASQQASQQQQQQQQQQHYQAAVGPAPERRHYSFDTDTESQRYPLGPVPPVDYDQTEGLGGVSVSSYDSIDDDRIDPAMRYPYHGELASFFIIARSEYLESVYSCIHVYNASNIAFKFDVSLFICSLHSALCLLYICIYIILMYCRRQTNQLPRPRPQHPLHGILALPVQLLVPR